MHSEIPIEVALWRIIDDVSPEELGLQQGGQQEEEVEEVAPNSKNLKCDLCNVYSTRKRVNMYHHVWRMHKGISMKEVMRRITNA